ncbi:unnamed protein product [Gongylonema pulchrum]|uniref:GOLD domain-containing protein n=1 Tax=Gongylonema pulchrum TaxID=637853 RepID=A0A183CY64_9BILA|nr:unnamed protein product [Gongylonema pulchrum]
MVAPARLAVNVQSQKVHLRVTSPSGQISKWYDGTDEATFTGVTEEPGNNLKQFSQGIYEICATTTVKTGQFVRLALIIHVQDQSLLSSYHERYLAQKNLENNVKVNDFLLDILLPKFTYSTNASTERQGYLLQLTT